MADENIYDFGPPTDNAADVPASVSKYGEDYGQEILDNTGEQNQSFAGDAAFNDATRPNQTTNDAGSVSNTTDYGDYGSPTGAGAAGTSTTVPFDPTAGLTPAQLQTLGTADPSDPYIRARLGIPQLPNSDLNSLPSASNFFNSIKDVATSVTSTAQKAVSALTAKTPAASPYAQQATVQKSLSALTSNAASPAQDAFGLNILDAAQTAQLTRNINPAFINSLTDPNAGTKGVYVDANGVAFDSATGVSLPVINGQQVIPPAVLANLDPAARDRITQFNQTPTISATAVDTGTGNAVAAANKETAAAAARLNAESPNPYLTNIDQAAAEISKGQEGIATATQTIQSAQQKISDSESYIAQNNAELANPDISAARRAELEANNAAQTQNIFDQNQSITENQTYIATTQETNQFNEATIDINSAGYRATTAGSNVPVVEVNSDPSFVGPQQITATVINPTLTAKAVDTNTASLANVAAATVGNATTNTTAAEASAIQTQVGRQLAQQQAVNAAQKKAINNGDWRVRLSLAPGANYLYNAPNPGILRPLFLTAGVIFPYTPKIQMNYKADYEQQVLTHSNYKGYFYKSSYVDQISLSATFTAQDTAEANYLLAVIHFFRSVTKMFYGQDPTRGAPPPLVYLTGLGEFQFSQHPCAVANFNYSLPADVDYIRTTSTNINGANMLTRRDRQTVASNPISGAVGRLQNLFSSQNIDKGAEVCRPPPPTLGQKQPTYVPTKIEIELTLYPMQSRQQVSRVFDNRLFNNGDQLKGGFW